MNFRNYSLQIALRILALVATIGLLFWLIWENDLFFVLIVIVAIILGQTIELWRYQNRLLTETRKFLEAVQFGDLSTRFDLAKSGKAFAELEQEFNKLLDIIQKSRAQGDQQEQVLSMILENINLGVMLIDDSGSIIISNDKCLEMLEIPAFKKWQRVADRLPQLAKALGDFDFSGRKLWVRGESSSAEEFYLDLQSIQMNGSDFHLLSIGTMRHALEEKEMEAWHRLIRILAHEVMNSVTPVVSLSETLLEMILKDRKLKAPSDLNEEDLTDMNEALKTIIRRSKGMLSFVEQYRRLSQLPAPDKSLVAIKDLFDDVLQLLKREATSKNINLYSRLEQNRLAVKADKKMIEQVLINLIKNAFLALEHQENPFVELSAELQHDGLVVCVRDNGEGIDPDLITQIFVPFFTTRKTGTGIGLSLSKNIMKLHQGDLKVQSVPGEGSLFRLCFDVE
jgi:two-component system nitrogen regulation sensor histidine kinase NtrY